MTPRALVIVSLALATVAACSGNATRMAGHDPVPDPTPIIRRVDPVHRSAPPPQLRKCQSDWCRANCTKANPAPPLQCRSFKMVDASAPRPGYDVPVGPELCRAAGKC